MTEYNYPTVVVADTLGEVYSRDPQNRLFTEQTASYFAEHRNDHLRDDSPVKYGVFKLVRVPTDREQRSAWHKAHAEQEVQAMNARVYAMSETDRLAWYTENTVESFLEPDFGGGEA